MKDIARQAREDPKGDWLLVALLVLPLAISLGKVLFAESIFSSFLWDGELPALLREAVETMLVIPLGAGVVVFFRFTLGIEVPGVLCPIVMAMAFNVVGIPPGLAFVLVLLAIVAHARIASTILVACITFAMTSYSPTLEFFIRFPEFLIAQAAFILVIVRYLDFRIFDARGPLFALLRRGP
jgi:hypothetical protein